LTAVAEDWLTLTLAAPVSPTEWNVMLFAVLIASIIAAGRKLARSILGAAPMRLGGMGCTLFLLAR
jgi:hypothetical protein